MFPILLTIHSINRWLVLILILLSVFTAAFYLISRKKEGNFNSLPYQPASSLAQLQLVLGIILYFKSPLTLTFIKNIEASLAFADITFFGLFHSAIMFVSVIIIQIGVSKAKREEESTRRNKIILVWYSVALLLILIAIPWPTISFVNRPLFRMFE